MDTPVQATFAMIVRGPDHEGRIRAFLIANPKLYGGLMEDGWSSVGGWSTEALRDIREEVWSAVSQALDGQPSLL